MPLPSSLLPALALLLNALVWGLAWWPFRLMHGAGLHPLWATAVMYFGVLVALLALRPGIVAQLRAHPQLWLLAVCSGLNNVAFNWAVTVAAASSDSSAMARSASRASSMYLSMSNTPSSAMVPMRMWFLTARRAAAVAIATPSAMASAVRPTGTSSP